MCVFYIYGIMDLVKEMEYVWCQSDLINFLFLFFTFFEWDSINFEVRVMKLVSLNWLNDIHIIIRFELVLLCHACLFDHPLLYGTYMSTSSQHFPFLIQHSLYLIFWLKSHMEMVKFTWVHLEASLTNKLDTFITNYYDK